MTSRRGVAAVRGATVQIRDRAGHHRGQGLALRLDDEGDVVLTCHHVVAGLARDDLFVASAGEGGTGSAVRAEYDVRRSRPESDAVVLRATGVAPSPTPLIHELHPTYYDGSLRVTGYLHLPPGSFEARLASSARLSLPAPPSQWPESPANYDLPAFRLSDATDSHPGISGAVVAAQGGVIGLAHAARPESPNQAREVYLVPLAVWAYEWPALAELIEPFVDERLSRAAIVKRAKSLDLGTDVTIDRRRDDVHLERVVEREARLALEEHGAVLIIGRPKSGKTTVACRLLEDRPDRIVVIPRASEPPNDFERAGFAERELILFFDDLHAVAEAVRPLEWLAAFEGPEEGRSSPLVASTRDGTDWERVQRKQARLLRDVFTPATRVFASRVGPKGHDLTHEAGLELAAKLGLNDYEFERAFDGTPGSLVLDLEDMTRRYEELRVEERGGIAASRLLDSAKLLHVAGQPRLRERLLWKVAAKIRGSGSLTREAWETLRLRTEDEGFGRFDPASRELVTYRPYLENCVTYEPDVEELEALVPILADEEDGEGMSYLASALADRQSASAEDAARRAISLGLVEAWVTLGEILAREPDRVVEAEQAYDEALSAGVTNAYSQLGNLLAEQPGREAEAEEAYRAAIAAGDEYAWHNLGGHLAEQPGREQDAEDAYRAAIEAGSPFAAMGLGDLFARQPGRESEAEEAYGRELETFSENLFAHINLGSFLEDQGRLDEAEEQYRAALDLGFPLAYLNLGDLLSTQPGREAEAEAAYRVVIDQQLSPGYVGLGRLLIDQPGREREAEEALRKASAMGDSDGSAWLGTLFYNEERLEEAEAVFRGAIAAGNPRGYVGLGYVLLRYQGQAAEAEAAFKAASDAGFDVVSGLVHALADQPGREAEAEEVLRAAIAAGHTGLYFVLAELLEGLPGREGDAAEAHRAAEELEEP